MTSALWQRALGSRMARSPYLDVGGEAVDALAVARRIAERYGLPVEELRVRGRATGRHRSARVALYVALRAYGWSYPAIGRFAGRDHATVYYALHPRRAVKRRAR